MRKTEIFTVLRVGLASPIARYSSGARIAGQRAKQNEQYKNTSYLILRDSRSIWRDDSTTRMTRVLCGGLLGAVATEAHGIELQDDGGFRWKASAYFLQPGNPEVIYEQAWIEHSLNSPRGTADAAHEYGSSIRCAHLEASPTRARLAQESGGTLLG
jgi:hypothetical protein